MHPQSTKPSLDNAYARVGRAKEHIARLKREITTIGRHDPKMSAPVATSGDVSTNAPPIISILVSEAIYNLRAALDYLVYELAIFDSRKIQKRTQFPIEDLPTDPGELNALIKRWRGARHDDLRGIDRRHKTMIRRLQPFRGCKWMARLRDISNPDKHRTLTVTRLSVSIPYNLSTVSKTIRFPANKSMKMEDGISFRVLFDDGSPVIQTVQMLQQQVTNVLDAFKPDVK